MSLPTTETDHINTYADYYSWPHEECWELIDGVAYDMSPAPSRRHQDISREIEMQIAQFLKDKPCKVYDAPFDVRLPDGDENEEDILTVVQPDIVVVCDKKKLDEKGCIGAPDIIIEILSPHSSVKDKKVKFALYEQHQVEEYWVIDPTDSTVMIFTLGKNKEYGKPKIFTKEDRITTPILEGLEIDLDPIFSAS